MTVKRLFHKWILVCFLLGLGSVCWGQYSTTYSQGITDITSYLPTTNAWKALPTKASVSLAETMDGSIYAIDPSGCAWSYNWQARTYAQQTALGCGWAEINAMTGDPTYPLLVGLLKVDATCPSGTKRFFWWYGSGSPTNTNTCAIHWLSGDGAAQLQVARTPAPSGFINGHTFFNNGSSYIDLGTGWISGYVANSVTACATHTGSGNTNVLYLLDPNGGFSVAPTQPPGSGKGFSWDHCLITQDGMLIVYGNGQTYRYDYTAGTWSGIMGGATNMAGVSKATILGLVSGQPSHLNIFAGYISGNTTGSVNVCPDAAHPCTQGATHTGTIQVRLLHGLAGAPANETSSPTAGINVASFDFSPKWDPMFGDPNDPEGQASATGDVICNVSGVAFAGSAGRTPPPTARYSVDFESWDYAEETWSSPIPGGYAAWKSCGSTLNACLPHTSAVCHSAHKGYGVAILGQYATDARALAMVKDKCQLGQFGLGRAWMVFFVYAPGIPGSCIEEAFFESKAFGPCY